MPDEHDGDYITVPSVQSAVVFDRNCNLPQSAILEKSTADKKGQDAGRVSSTGSREFQS